MMFARLLAPLLFVVATNGQSRCRLDDSCTPGLTTVELDICAFTDEDLNDVGACFDNVGRGNIEYLNLRRNDFVNITAGFFDGFDALTELDLDLNELNPQAGTFRGLTSLDSLTLTRNGIRSLPSGFFEGLDSLRYLDLFRNHIEFATGDFINATSLEVLILREAISGDLASGVFKGLDSLLSLSMSETGLTTLPTGAFDGLSNLQRLSISRNRITALPDGIFGELANLQELYVTENSFTTWTAGILNGLTSLTTLRLNDMPLITLEAGTFDGTPSLEDLDMSFNIESTLPAGIFTAVAGSLINLDLNTNSLSTFPADNLDDFLSLQTLNISSNSLILQPGFFQNANSLEYLVLSGSNDSLASGLFEGLASLRALDISGVDIVLPTGVFDDLTSLTSLTLSGNAFALPMGVFDNLASLTSLSLIADLATLGADTFVGTPALEILDLSGNDLSALSPGVFVGFSSLTSLRISGNNVSVLPNSVFDGLESLTSLTMSGDGSTLPTGILDGLASLTSLDMSSNDLTRVPANVFRGLASLQELDLSFNELTTVSANGFDGLGSLQQLLLNGNDLTTLPTNAFRDLVALEELFLNSNDLTTLPAGLFDGLDSLQELDLERNHDLQCLPATDADNVELPFDVDEDSTCACPAEPVCNDDGFRCECQSGINGYSCVGSSSELTRAFSCPSSDECTSDEQCADDEVCCPASRTCESLFGGTTSACGDPHMTGFRGQKFDFTGEDGGWYALISALPSFHMNMRVTAPVSDLPDITYITGISLLAIGSDGMEHSIVISVKHPHSLGSSCPSGLSTCLAEGALNVVIDGDIVLATPGTATSGLGVEISAVNLPGACRSFGFEKYWERKMLEKLRVGQGESFEPKSMAEFVADVPPAPSSQAMSEWILGDPTATNMMECAAYVAESMHTDGGIFAHQSEHASFKISTPSATVRVSHGRLHQLAMRDPSGQFDLPDHLTWQMNLAVDLNEISRLTAGVLGETFVPTVDGDGNAIMNGMKAIRGTQESYRVAGPFDVAFAGSTKQA